MSTLEPNEPEGWTLSEYKSFHVTNNDSESSDTDSDDEEEQILMEEYDKYNKSPFRKKTDDKDDYSIITENGKKVKM